MLASLDRRKIVWLDYNEKGKVAQKGASFARGASIENILASFFYVPGAVDEAASEIYVIDALLEQGNAEEAQKAIEALRDRFGEIPALLDPVRRVHGRYNPVYVEIVTASYLHIPPDPSALFHGPRGPMEQGRGVRITFVLGVPRTFA